MKIKYYSYEESSKAIKSVLAEAKKHKEIIAVALFGSLIKGRGRDIDLCLFLDKRKSNLEMSKLKRKMSGQAGPEADIQIFQQLPLYIRARIIKEGRILEVNNLDRLYEIYFETIKEHGLFKRKYLQYLESVKNG